MLLQFQSQIYCLSSMVLLVTVMNLKVRCFGDHQWQNVHTKFHENRLPVSRVKKWKPHSDVYTHSESWSPYLTLFGRMSFSRMWHRVDLVWTNVSKEHISSIFSRLLTTCSLRFLARRFFYAEDGGNTFLRNVGSHKFYTAPQPRRRHSS
jgi:hypothetical protein